MTHELENVIDEMLVMLAVEGDREALDRLARRWSPRHHAHARRLLNGSDYATDAVQEAWVNITRGLARLKEPSRFPAWSYAIVTSRCRDIMRKPYWGKECEWTAEHEKTITHDGEQDDDLRRNLRKLPPDQRAAIALFYRDGLSVAEIAIALKTPAGTIKTRLFHARNKLRQHFEGELR
tara:strand:- start:4304 stop:4840 length:537 start_codon:yes stop_codon:yes gene_type:complete